MPTNRRRPRAGRASARAGLALSLVLALTTAACRGGPFAGPQPSPGSGSPAPSAPATTLDPCGPAPVQLRFSFRPGVSAAERVLIRRAVRLAREYLPIERPSCQEDAVVVHVWTRSAGLVVARAVRESTIEVFTGSPGWVAASPTRRTAVLVHEWLHLVQYREGSWFYLSFIPGWLAEGAAEWVAFRGVSEFGLASFAGIQRAQRAEARLARAPLSSWRPAEPGGYPLAFTGVDFLVTPDRGKAAILRFFQMVGEGVRWQEAFRGQFGMTVERFYREFERYRSRGFRP